MAARRLVSSLHPPPPAHRCDAIPPPNPPVPLLKYAFLAAGVFWFVTLGLVEWKARGERRVILRCLLAIPAYLLVTATLQGLGRHSFVRLDLIRGAVAATALAAFAYDHWRTRAGRPLALAIQRRAGLVLAVAAMAAYLYPAPGRVMTWRSLWDPYHYYVGGKYFPELGYDGLYRCSVVAEDELGVVRWTENGAPRAADLRAEARALDRTYREPALRHDNAPSGYALSRADACRARFSPERWREFRADIRDFRVAMGDTVWAPLLRDYGYNAPPVWMVLGRPLVARLPASLAAITLVSGIDAVLFALTFAALGWAFGWRVAVVGMVFYGTNTFNTFFWPGGSILRQDWFFLLILSACLARKRRFRTAGAAFAWAGLIRIFPLAMGLGLAAQAFARWRTTRRIPRAHLRFAVGSALAIVVLVPASMAASGGNPYPDFVRAIRLLDETPVLNHTGLRAAASHRWGRGEEAGRTIDVLDRSLPDPLLTWRKKRAEHWTQARPFALAAMAVLLGWLCWTAARARSLWMALCLGPVAVITTVQVMSYYYSFPVLVAPLTRVRRWLEVWLIGFAAASQLVAAPFAPVDDRFAAISLLAVAFAVGILVTMRPRKARSRPTSA